MDPEAERLEAFHSLLRTYLWTIGVLGGSADRQCELMGNHNVAWELRDDTRAGRALITEAPAKFFTDDQVRMMMTLAEAIDQIPESVIGLARGEVGNAEAMQAVAWRPVRDLALRVLTALEPAAQENAWYLRGEQ